MAFWYKAPWPWSETGIARFKYYEEFFKFVNEVLVVNGILPTIRDLAASTEENLENNQHDVQSTSPNLEALSHEPGYTLFGNGQFLYVGVT